MKLIRNLFALAFIFAISSLFAQDWLENLPEVESKQDLTLADYNKAFNTYWEPYSVKKGRYVDTLGIERKAPGWKQFQRWYYSMEYQVDEAGKFPTASASDTYDNYLLNNPPAMGSAIANWTNMGPSASTGGYAGIGRLNCIAFHPTDNNTYWVGAPAGGLWLTQDNGSTWACLTDQNPVLGLSDIAIPSDYETSNTIYIATGDRDSWDNRSEGVLKSMDGGLTWNTTGISFQLSDAEIVSRILIDPNDDETLLAATTNGVYKTTDGGVTWSNRLIPTYFIDMEFKPGDFNTLYGSTTSGYIYTSADGGQNWSITLNNGQRRIELAVSPNNPAYVYAISANSTTGGLYGIYRSTDSGITFTQTFDGTISGNNMMGWYTDGSDTGGQGSYDLSIAVSPTDANRVIIGGVNTWGSTDGGSTWNPLNCWTRSTYYNSHGVPEVHADKHMIRYRPNGDLFECNDGGIYLSTDDAVSFTDKTNGIVISQIYKIGVGQTSDDETILGLQDNGTKTRSNGSWDDVIGGDGMDCIIDYSNSNTQYGSLYYGSFYRTTNHWGSRTYITPEAAGGGAWVTPIVMDPVDHNTIYAGFSEVWKSTDQGNSWTQISNIDASYYRLRSLAVAPSDNNFIYAGDYHNFWRTTDGGATWADLTAFLPAGLTMPGITVEENDPNRVWITCGGFSSHIIYQSLDGGNSWTSIAQGLPEIPFYTIVQDKKIEDEIYLYAGSESGVFFKKGDEDWIPFNEGLPMVTTRELEIYYADNPEESKLRLATYGRGLWESNLVSSEELTVTDIDGNEYQTVLIGEQRWMAENLKVTSYADGTPIPLVEEAVAWSDLTYDDRAYCWYDNDPSNGDIYGALYTWAGAMNGEASSNLIPSGVQGVCPDGWHLPSDDEWKELEVFLGMSLSDANSDGWRGTDEGGKLKQEGTALWSSPNTGATNETGFTALPGGDRNGDGGFANATTASFIWAATEHSYNPTAYRRLLNYENAGIQRQGKFKDNGSSVRCVQDQVPACTLPEGWTVNPPDFAYNGQVSVQLIGSDGAPVESGYLAAFVNGECRGVSSASYFMPADHYIFELMCYSNQASGEMISFEYFNDDICEVQEPGLCPTIEFTADMIIGNAASPIALESCVQASTTFEPGWNWFSINVEDRDNMALGHVLNCSTVGDYIKTQTASATYYDEIGWYGTLEELNVLETFKIKVNNQCETSLLGIPTDVSTSSLTIPAGWSWISYLPQEQIPTVEALGSLTLESGDYIKTQSTSATYYNDYGWYGSLEIMDPLEGYMMKKLTEDVLFYPEEASGPFVPSLQPDGSSDSFNEMLDPRQFENSGSVTARVFLNGSLSGEEGDRIIAYVDDQCRGYGLASYFQPADAFTFTTMVYSNMAAGEILSFKYYDASSDQLYPCNETLEFTADMIVADALQAFELNVNSILGLDNPVSMEGLTLSVYPNPFRDEIQIKYTVPERTKVTVGVFDMLGRSIEIIEDRVIDAGTFSTSWDAESYPGGTYILKLSTNEGSVLRKIIYTSN